MGGSIGVRIRIVGLVGWLCTFAQLSKFSPMTSKANNCHSFPPDNKMSRIPHLFFRHAIPMRRGFAKYVDVMMSLAMMREEILQNFVEKKVTTINEVKSERKIHIFCFEKLFC